MAVKRNAMAMMTATLSPEAAERSDLEAERMLALINLAELREAFQIKQTEIGGMSQPSISRLEHRKDLKPSTYFEYLFSMDLELELVVRPKHPRPGVPDHITLLRT